MTAAAIKPLALKLPLPAKQRAKYRSSGGDGQSGRWAKGHNRVAVFGPGSLTWRVNGEAVLLLGGGRALLLQVAHPGVAAGVAEFSNYREDPCAASTGPLTPR